MNERNDVVGRVLAGEPIRSEAEAQAVREAVADFDRLAERSSVADQRRAGFYEGLAWLASLLEDGGKGGEDTTDDVIAHLKAYLQADAPSPRGATMNIGSGEEVFDVIHDLLDEAARKKEMN